MHVSIDPLPVLIRGNDALATARAWQIMAAGDSQPLTNVTFVWSSDSTSIATVDATGHVVGIKSGTTMIRARVANFDRQSLPGEITLRVSAPLEVDSIRPQAVRYGETVTVYGVGVDSIFQASIGDGVLIPYFFSNVRDSTGSAQITYWVPPPAQSDSLFFIGNGVFGFSKDTVRVMRGQGDLYEPNELSPNAIDLETSRPFPGTVLDFFLFLNPALAFEQLPRDVVEGVEWYRLTQTAQRDLTIVVSSDVPGTFETFLTDSLRFQASDTSYRVGPDSWTFGPEEHACHGVGFAPKEAPSESTVVALKDFPTGALHAIAAYTQPGRYALSVSEGYATTGKGIKRDAHEEDDYCNAADTKRVLLAQGPIRDTLTIDNPHDVDWFRFNFPGGTYLSVRTAARPLGAVDESDIDVYVLRAPSPAFVASSTRPTSTEVIDILFPSAGEYYVVVIDFAGVPTRYSLCIGIDTCTLPAASASRTADLQMNIARRARLEAAIARRSPRSPALRVPSRVR